MNNKQKTIKVSNIYLEVQARYLKTTEGNKRQWLAQNILVMVGDQQVKYDEVIINFTHIDDDNPEFFLQPGQVIKVLEGEIELNNMNQALLNINIFRQTDEQERIKINHI
ncbi:hypothetical protein J8J04_02010 ['Fragaria x ananassa' phyllody phytoplasma]|uniref:Uncharacterized protein n=1 Tax='Fragaria x ananassa' phyllody phytoplasma TaxID=2358428 RepID=A0ABS5K3G6_9MOLU|nr:hypothetical protein ['Fragaria x ananassa' phyllody phytoplasma]MBS2126458.1 hypothetical protein ['Fragaria x ananassa' phyllody phytoplasma]